MSGLLMVQNWHAYKEGALNRNVSAKSWRPVLSVQVRDTERAIECTDSCQILMDTNYTPVS